MERNRGDPDVLRLITPPLLRAFSYRGDDPFLSEPMFSITVVENTLGVTLKKCKFLYTLYKVSCQNTFPADCDANLRRQSSSES